MQFIAPVHPIPLDPAPGSRTALLAVLRKIDGWGQGAWREIYCTWRLRQCVISVDDLEAGVSRDDDDRVAAFVVVFENHALGRSADAVRDAATCDWVLREAWLHLLTNQTVTATTHRPGPEIRATNACVYTEPSPHQAPTIILRLLVRLPMAGMCCDGKALARFIKRIESFADSISRRRKRPSLDLHRLTHLRQHALRQALNEHGFIAFIGDGAKLARTSADLPAEHCKPWRTPAAERTTIDLGPFGRVRGLGIRHGITAIAGAPYHGKSTVLSALAAGRENHIPHDGREMVVSHESAVVIQAEDGRRIKTTDVSPFFKKLPGGPCHNFTTERASGATSMAASLLQSVAGGCQLLLIDEDSAASNFLSIDPIMRSVLGAALDGFTTVLETLPYLAAHGINTVLVAGANHQSLQVSNHIVVMEQYQPNIATKKVQRLLARSASKKIVIHKKSSWHNPQRFLHDHPDCLFGPRHFLRVDVTEPERPLIEHIPLDLRRCGWALDKALVRGALAAAGWCCRLANGHPMPYHELQQRYLGLISTYGARGLDPFDTALLTIPPWELVVTILERLARPQIVSQH